MNRRLNTTEGPEIKQHIESCFLILNKGKIKTIKQKKDINKIINYQNYSRFYNLNDVINYFCLVKLNINKVVVIKVKYKLANSYYERFDFIEFVDSIEVYKAYKKYLRMQLLK